MSGVTVVIAAHRRREPLRRAIASVVAQTRSADAIVVCQDGDDPAVAAIATEAGAGRTQVLRLPTGESGPAAARNLGIEAATSAWVAFLDDDDEWHPEHLAGLIWPRGSADLYCSNAVTRSSGRLLIPRRESGPVSQFAIARSNPVITSTVIARTAALRAVGGFDPPHTGIEDLDLWLRLVAAGYRIWFDSAPSVTYDDTGDDRMSLRRAEISRQRAARLTTAASRTRHPRMVLIAAHATASAVAWSGVGGATRLRRARFPAATPRQSSSG